MPRDLSRGKNEAGHQAQKASRGNETYIGVERRLGERRANFVAGGIYNFRPGYERRKPDSDRRNNARPADVKKG